MATAGAGAGWHRRAAGVALLAGMLSVAGCGTPTADQDQTRRRLVAQAALSEAQATCVVDRVWGMDDTDVRAELAEDSPELDDAQEAALKEVLRSCGALP